MRRRLERGIEEGAEGEAGGQGEDGGLGGEGGDGGEGGEGGLGNMIDERPDGREGPECIEGLDLLEEETS